MNTAALSAEPVLVTGIGRRLGLELALHLMRRGVPVIGTHRSDRPGVDLLRSQGAELHACDFDDEAQLQGLVDEVKRGHERLRAVIHNASDWLPDDHSLPPREVMRRMMQVHVVAPYVINLGLAPLLEASASAHADIIHIGDYVSSRGSTRHIAYAASATRLRPLRFAL